MRIRRTPRQSHLRSGKQLDGKHFWRRNNAKKARMGQPEVKSFVQGKPGLGFPGVDASGWPIPPHAPTPRPFSAKFSCRNFSSSLENAALNIILGNSGSLSRPFGGQDMKHYFCKSTSGPPPRDSLHRHRPTVKKGWGDIALKPWPGPCSYLSTVLTLETHIYPDVPMSATLCHAGTL